MTFFFFSHTCRIPFFQLKRERTMWKCLINIFFIFFTRSLRQDWELSIKFFFKIKFNHMRLTSFGGSFFLSRSLTHRAEFFFDDENFHSSLAHACLLRFLGLCLKRYKSARFYWKFRWKFCYFSANALRYIKMSKSSHWTWEMFSMVFFKSNAMKILSVCIVITFILTCIISVLPISLGKEEVIFVCG